MKTRPHKAADHHEEQQTRQPGLESHPDNKTHEKNGNAQEHQHRDVGHHQSQQKRRAPNRCQAETVEVTVLDVGDQGRRSGHAGHGKGDGHRNEEGLVVQAARLARHVLQCTKIDDVEEGGDEDGGNHRRRFPPHLPKRTAGHRGDVTPKPSLTTQNRARVDDRHAGTASLNVRSRQLHEDVVERGSAQSEGANAKRRCVQGDRHWAQFGWTVLCAHDDPSRRHRTLRRCR